MKLAFCLFKYFPFGGMQRDFLRIAQECLARGHQVDVFTSSWEGEKDPRLFIHLIASKGWQNHTRQRHFVAQIQPYLHPYDLVIGFNKMPGLDVYFAADSCYQAKVRLQHGAFYRLTPRYQHLVAYEQAVFSPAAKTEILLIAKKQQAEFVRYYHTPAIHFHLLPPGITQDRIAPHNAASLRTETRREWNIKEDAFLLLFVGSGFKTKGLDRVLLGLAALPTSLKEKTYLYIIGKDNPKLFLQQAKQLGIAEHIKFLGGRHDVPRFLLAADLLLHPAYDENTGTVLLEAIASGLPVLTTDVCGYADYIEQAQAGRVIKSPFKQIQFNQTLLSMLLSPDRKQWQQNALTFAKKADIYSLPTRAVDAIESFLN